MQDKRRGEFLWLLVNKTGYTQDLNSDIRKLVGIEGKERLMIVFPLNYWVRCNNVLLFS